MDPVTLIVSALALAACVEPLLRDGFEVDDAKRALGDYSLVRGAPGDLLTVHRLVQAITLDRLDESARAGWRDAAAALVEAALPVDPESPGRCSWDVEAGRAAEIPWPGEPPAGILIG